MDTLNAHIAQVQARVRMVKMISCLVCIKEQKVKATDSTSGLVCSVCNGVGITEPKSARLHNRIVPVLAMMIVYFALFLVMILSTKEHFSEILAFAATLIGSVTGYYFGGKTRKGSY